MIGKPGLPSRSVLGPPSHVLVKALDLVLAIGGPDGSKETRDRLAQLRDATVAYETARDEAEAKVAEASKAIDAADAAQQLALQMRRQTENDCAKLRESIAADQGRLSDAAAEHDAGVRSDTEALVARESAVAEREAVVRRGAAALANDINATEAAKKELAAREAAVQERENAQTAREQRLKAALG